MDFPADLVQRLQTARHVAVFTGAGVSAESGIPTFRDAQTGLWARFRAEDLATPQAFLNDPQTVWAWYEWRRDLMRDVQPNPGHHAIAALEQHVQRVSVLTQNVDGLHRRAGSTCVVELHGNIWSNRCIACGRGAELAGRQPTVPHCIHCGELVRPSVVWFGEALPEAAWLMAAEAVREADIFLCVGTSSLVEPAASLPRVARDAGSIMVQINPEPTAHDAIAHYVLRGRAGHLLPALAQAALCTGNRERCEHVPTPGID